MKSINNSNESGKQDNSHLHIVGVQEGACELLQSEPETFYFKQHSPAHSNNLANAFTQPDDPIFQIQLIERRRIGILLRDNINQVLAATKLYVDLLEPIDESQADIRQRAKTSLMQAINEINNLSRPIAGFQYKETGLIDNINNLIDELGLVSFNSIQLTCFNTDIEKLGLYHKILIFRVVKQLLEHIKQNKLVKNVEIYLQFTNNRVLIVIDNNMVKFEQAGLSEKYGIEEIRQLLNIYNGHVKMHTAPQRCILEIGIPCL